MVDIYSNIAFRLGNALENFTYALGALLVVIVALAIGWLVGRAISWVVKRLMHEAKVEQKLKKVGLDDAIGGINLTTIFSVIIELATIAVFLGIAAESIDLSFFSGLVTWFVGYIPSLVQGIIIIVIALYAIDYVTDKIKAAKALPFAKLITAFVQIFVVYTAVVMATPLILPGADVQILSFTFYVLIGAVGLAIGLGFAIAIGFGAKDTVAKIAERKREEMDRVV
jgi:hypothetical protein